MDELNDILSRLIALRTHNLPSGLLKKRLWRFMKRFFNLLKGHVNPFSASWATKKEFWTNTWK
jgi:hypothetical protein